MTTTQTGPLQQSMLNLEGRRALVTGGGTGIGAAIAVALAEAGADVAFTYLSHPGEEVAEQIRALGRRVYAAPLDATQPDEVTRVVADAAAALGGPIDLLVNNAGGLVARASLADMSVEHWHTVMDLNLTSAFLVTQAVVRQIPDGGRIVNISSQAGRNGGGAGASVYAASKAGMHGLTLTWAKESATAASPSTPSRRGSSPTPRSTRRSPRRPTKRRRSPALRSSGPASPAR